MGRYFDVPARPAERDAFWSKAEPLTPATLPHWLTAEFMHYFRRVKSPSFLGLSAAERAHYDRELQCLIDLGLVVESESDRHAVYIKASKVEPIWSIGIYSGPSPLRLTPVAGNPILTRDDVSDVAASYVADPFLHRTAEGWHLFFEVWNWRIGMGEIGHASSVDGYKWKYQQIVLREPFHLSYPYVFAGNDGIYMIPESHQAGEVRLYRAAAFPSTWVFVATLLRGEYLADASIIYHAGTWWLFVDASPGGRHDTLRLFLADELPGPWREHPCSPIVAHDPENARPAGRIIVCNGQMIRFAQNSQPEYGTDVRAFVIATLTATEYREIPCGPRPLLGPSGHGWNAGGMHHIDAQILPDGSWLAAIDGWYLAIP